MRRNHNENRSIKYLKAKRNSINIHLIRDRLKKSKIRVQSKIVFRYLQNQDWVQLEVLNYIKLTALLIKLNKNNYKLLQAQRQHFKVQKIKFNRSNWGMIKHNRIIKSIKLVLKSKIYLLKKTVFKKTFTKSALETIIQKLQINMSSSKRTNELLDTEIKDKNWYCVMQSFMLLL